MSEDGVYFWCDEHAQKERPGRWINNEVPFVCDECRFPAVWILVLQQLKDNEALASLPRMEQ